MNDIQRYCGKIYGKTYSELVMIEPETFAQKEAIREALIETMKKFPDADAAFWSVIIVLDGDFLRLPNFIAMVNGGTTEYPNNGWHGLYVFSEKFSGGRIYPVNLDFGVFREHALTAANYWLSQRQWFNESWRADIS